MSLALTTTGSTQDVVLDHISMVRAIAYRIHSRLPRSVDVDDLISVGVIGLMEAIERYEADRMVAFEQYARHRVHGAIMDALRAADWVPRSVRRHADRLDAARRSLMDDTGREPTPDEMSAQLGVSVDEYQGLISAAEIRQLLSLDAPMGADSTTPLVEAVADSGDDLLTRWQLAEQRVALLEAIDLLPDRERTAIALYYLHEMSLKDVGKVLGVTESRACQIAGAAVKRLRTRLREHAA
jgi:RNA polymerase sigma factor for flagellar operon FliA